MKYLLTYKLFEKKFEKPKEISPKELEKRWDKKRNAIKNLANNIEKLKNRVDKDLSSDDEKLQLTAAIVKIIEMTGERVGNEESKENGHYGITNLKKKHISLTSDGVKLKYTGKSGVNHERIINNPKLKTIISKLLKRPSSEIFVTDDGFSIKAPQVNRYLAQFDITSKDLRGFKCNKLMTKKLKNLGKVDEKDIKTEFNRLLRDVAEQIGHTPATLRKHYLLPEIEKNFYDHGSIGRVQKI